MKILKKCRISGAGCLLSKLLLMLNLLLSDHGLLLNIDLILQVILWIYTANNAHSELLICILLLSHHLLLPYCIHLNLHLHLLLHY